MMRAATKRESNIDVDFRSHQNINLPSNNRREEAIVDRPIAYSYTVYSVQYTVYSIYSIQYMYLDVKMQHY